MIIHTQSEGDLLASLRSWWLGDQRTRSKQLISTTSPVTWLLSFLSRSENELIIWWLLHFRMWTPCYETSFYCWISFVWWVGSASAESNSSLGHPQVRKPISRPSSLPCHVNYSLAHRTHFNTTKVLLFAQNTFFDIATATNPAFSLHFLLLLMKPEARKTWLLLSVTNCYKDPPVDVM